MTRACWARWSGEQIPPRWWPGGCARGPRVQLPFRVLGAAVDVSADLDPAAAVHGVDDERHGPLWRRAGGRPLARCGAGARCRCHLQGRLCLPEPARQASPRSKCPDRSRSAGAPYVRRRRPRHDRPARESMQPPACPPPEARTPVRMNATPRRPVLPILTEQLGEPSEGSTQQPGRPCWTANGISGACWSRPVPVIAGPAARIPLDG